MQRDQRDQEVEGMREGHARRGDLARVARDGRPSERRDSVELQSPTRKLRLPSAPRAHAMYTGIQRIRIRDHTLFRTTYVAHCIDVILLPKESAPQDFNMLRPISILPSSAKSDSKVLV